MANTKAAPVLEAGIKTKTKAPSKFAVIMHNDDYTTTQFVVSVLKLIFRKTHREAEKLTVEIHSKGKAVVGVYPYDIAEYKVSQTRLLAEEQDFPLKLTMEPV